MSTRLSAVADKFYPSDKNQLSNMINSYLNSKSEKNNYVKIDYIHGLIVPHAGYEYSGAIAGEAYKKILGKHYKRVILLCPNHTMFLNKIAYDTNSHWQTPFGNIEVDKEAISGLNKDLFIQGASTHLKEHAIEVQLPFLQKTLSNFRIIPLVVGVLNKNEISKAAEEIQKIMNHETLLIISTDLSHFLPNRNAESVDAHTINAILSNDENSSLDACGSYALKILQKICAHKKIRPKLIEYSHSGKITGQNSKVVGYASFWF